MSAARRLATTPRPRLDQIDGLPLEEASAHILEVLRELCCESADDPARLPLYEAGRAHAAALVELFPLPPTDSPEEDDHG